MTAIVHPPTASAATATKGSAESQSNKLVHFEWAANAASHTKVFVTGEFDNWSQSIQLTKSEDGSAFTASVTLAATVQPGDKIQFKFVVDGEWKTSSAFPIQNDGNGNDNNVFTVPEPIIVSEIAVVAAEAPVVVAPIVQKLEAKEEKVQAKKDVNAEKKPVVETAPVVVAPIVQKLEKKEEKVQAKKDVVTEKKPAVETAPVVPSVIASIQKQVVAEKNVEEVKPVAVKESSNKSTLERKPTPIPQSTAEVVTARTVAVEQKAAAIVTPAKPTTPTIKDNAFVNATEKKTSPSLAQKVSSVFRKSSEKETVPVVTPPTVAAGTAAAAPQAAKAATSEKTGFFQKKKKVREPRK
ncbi:UNVERIFIED_CONTAM: hypothetical protein HDU68_000444 [Siphonaria sp. JEL0065]|nr:hypothetical protein HDU68_000444 [Siphonaria sp. JEL0065]